jgi:hypothetical protein
MEKHGCDTFVQICFRSKPKVRRVKIASFHKQILEYFDTPATTQISSIAL